ncbi:MAG: CoA transferase subunit A [Acidobacteria bacterium]|nr:CoA transferase subunit A [Acidobacteriota bacterium]
MAEFLSLSAAISRLVAPGASVALEGFTHLIPFAAGHEIIRQELTGLTLIRMTPDLLYDQMIGCGCARKLVFSWGGNPGVGSLHRFRDAVEHGWPHPLDIEEHSHAAMALAYAAGASGMPCAIFREYFGSDLVQANPRIQFVTCPFTGERLAAVDDLETEGTNAVVLPSWTIDAVVLAPGGARPSYAHGYYQRDNTFYTRWDEFSRDRKSFRQWIDREVRRVGGPAAGEMAS